jgi:hypothetical protein
MTIEVKITAETPDEYAALVGALARGTYNPIYVRGFTEADFPANVAKGAAIGGASINTPHEQAQNTDAVLNPTFHPTGTITVTAEAEEVKPTTSRRGRPRKEPEAAPESTADTLPLDAQPEPVAETEAEAAPSEEPAIVEAEAAAEDGPQPADEPEVEEAITIDFLRGRVQAAVKANPARNAKRIEDALFAVGKVKALSALDPSFYAAFLTKVEDIVSGKAD